MKWTDVADDWGAFQEPILTRWPGLDADDVAAVDGDRARFNALLGQVEGLSPREAEEEIDAWLAGPMPADAKFHEAHDNANIRESARSVPDGEDVYADDRRFGDDGAAVPPVGRD